MVFSESNVNHILSRQLLIQRKKWEGRKCSFLKQIQQQQYSKTVILSDVPITKLRLRSFTVFSVSLRFEIFSLSVVAMKLGYHSVYTLRNSLLNIRRMSKRAQNKFKNFCISLQFWSLGTKRFQTRIGNYTLYSSYCNDPSCWDPSCWKSSFFIAELSTGMSETLHPDIVVLWHLSMVSTFSVQHCLQCRYY